MPKPVELVGFPGGTPDELVGYPVEAAAVDSIESAGGDCLTTPPEQGFDGDSIVRSLNVGTGAVLGSVEVTPVRVDAT